MIPATPAEQRDLVRLQDIDTALRRLRHRRAHLPEQQALDEHEDTFTRVRREAVAARERLERLDAQQRRHEQEIAAVEARRKADEARMYSGAIQSERELEALRHELGTWRMRKNDLEDSLLEIMEQQDEVGSLAETLAARETELRESITAAGAARDEAATDIDAEVAEREGERKAAAALVPERALTRYDELRERKNGLAVARLNGRTCSGCQLDLTAIDIEEVRAAAKHSLASCEQCGRILVPA